MNKRIFVFGLFCVFCYSFVSGRNWQDFQVDGIYYSIISNDPNEVCVSSKSSYNSSYSGEVIIPESVNYNGIDYKVTEIGTLAFYHCGNLTKVQMPEGITKINSAAFGYCINLETINIPSSVETISHQVFFECESLKEITLPISITSLGIQTFFSCTSLKKCTIKSNIKNIPKETFFLCRSLESITMPETITMIDTCAFSNCTSLENVILPEKVQVLRSSAFGGCPLRTINIPASLTVIESQAFAVKENIQLSQDNSSFALNNGILYTKDMKTLIVSPASTVEAIIPNSVTKIYAGAFQSNTNLISVVLPNTLDSIADGLFYGCSNLANVEIPNTVTFIGELAFGACLKLDNIQLPKSLRSIGSYAFAYTQIATLNLPEKLDFLDELAFGECKKLESIKIPESIDSISRKLFWECDELRNVELPNSLTRIGDYAFYACKSLQSLQIPPAVNKINSTAFLGCSSLKALDVSSSNSTYCSIDGVVYTKDMTKLFRCPPGREKIVEIPNTVKVIGEYAFSQCRSFSALNLPESVVELEPYSLNSLALENITLPSSLTTIKNAALYSNFKNIYCTSLKPPVWDLGDNPYKTYTFTDEVFNNSTLYIPGGTTFRYKDAKVWNQFLNIKEYDFSEIEAPEEENITVKVENDEIIIKNKPLGMKVLVYNVLGQNIYTGTNNVISGLNKDIYIVCVGKIRKKIRL